MQTLTSSRALREFIPISPLMLSGKKGLSVDVFIKVDAYATPKLYCSRRLQVNPRQLQLLLDAGITKLYVERDSYQSYLSELRSNWERILNEDYPLEADRAGLMCEVARAVLEEQFNTNDTSSIVNTCKQLSCSVIDILQQRPVLVSSLHASMSHDDAIGTHSSNVGIYIAVLARELGFTGDELQQIVVGALLHDIGKLEVSDEILGKPERLNEFEFRTVQKHPSLGLRRLVSEQQELTFGQLMMVYQHHEKLNGTGYPVGVPCEEIHPWAKICSVVDAFEALTSLRPYRNPLSFETALAVLEKIARTQLDETVVKCWKSLVLCPY